MALSAEPDTLHERLRDLADRMRNIQDTNLAPYDRDTLEVMRAKLMTMSNVYREDDLLCAYLPRGQEGNW